MKIATLDFETDPFSPGRIVEPFTWGLYTGSDSFVSYWSHDATECISHLADTLRSWKEPLTIYAHNGGRFDFMFLIPHFTGNMRIINARIVQAHLGVHEFRDSYAIMPFALGKYKKDDFDYTMLEKSCREKHREEIIRYMRHDCEYLYELVSSFVAEFTPKLTIGSASLTQLRKFHKFSCGGAQFDGKFRRDYYYGGRVQCFKPGITEGDIKVYDVNSMYPYVMASCLHPIGTSHEIDTRIKRNTCFVSVRGRNLGAFPVRTKDGIDFTQEEGIFHITIHEWEAALETKTFEPIKIIKTFGFHDRGTFVDWVEHFYNARLKAAEDHDTMHVLFYKYVLNSGYGKFAQNPANFFDYEICNGKMRPTSWHDCGPECETPCPHEWTPAYLHGSVIIWKRPVVSSNFYNVCVGASITGAARAHLLRGINVAENPIYCDTDSIICQSFPSDQVDTSRLGAWKLEVSGTRVSVGGKKLYAIFDEAGECVKKACKGSNLEGHEIDRIARGAVIESVNPVPRIGFDGRQTFTKRKVRATC